MRPRILSILALALLTLAVGCVTFNRSVFKTEQAAATLADTAMKVWADYYTAARANPAAFNTDVAKLDAQRSQIDKASVQVGTSLQVLDKLRADYAAGVVDKPAVQSAMAAVSKNADSIVALVKLFLPPQQAALVK
jgi:hypothetical protein